MARRRLTRKKVNDHIVDNALRDIYDKIDGLMPETDGKPSKRPPRAGDTQVVTTDDGIVTDIIYDGKQWLVNVNGNFHPAVNSNGYNTGEGTKGWSKKPIAGESVKYDSNAAVPIVNKKGQNIDIINNDGNLAIDSNIVIGKGDSAGKITSKGDQDLILDTGSTNTGSITITDGDNGNIAINAHGTGKISVDGDVDLSSGSKFKINGTDLAASDIGGITTDSSDTLTNKNIDSDNNTITNIVNADIKSGAAIDTNKISGSVTDIVSNGLGDLAVKDTINNDDWSGTKLSSGNIASANTWNSKNRIFKQDDPPTSLAVGDIWLDTNDDNKLYVAAAAGANEIAADEWVLHKTYAAKTEALASAVNIGGVSFDGSISIDLPGVNTTGNQNTSGTAAKATGIDTNSNGFVKTGSGDGTVSISANVDLTSDVTGNLPDGNIASATTWNGKLDKAGTIANGDFAQFDSNGDLAGKDADETKTALSLQNVTNESKATMFADPIFTGTSKINNNASNTMKFYPDDTDEIMKVDIVGGLKSTVLRFMSGATPHWQCGFDPEDSDDIFKINAGTSLADPSDFELSQGGNLVLQGTITPTGIVLGTHTISDVDVGSEFNDVDDHLMSSGAIKEKIESYNYLSGTIDISSGTNLVAGTNISLSGDTLNVDDVFITNNADDIMQGTLTIDKNYALDATTTINGLDIDIDETGAMAATRVLTTHGIFMDIDSSSPTHDSGSGINTFGAKFNLTTNTTTATSAQTGLHMTILGGDAAESTGMYINNLDGGTDIKLVSSADTGDYCSISTTTHGATTIFTDDDDGNAGSLTLDIDGDIILDSHTGITRFRDGGDTNDAFQITVVGGTGATTLETLSEATDGHLTLDVDGDIELNADGGDIVFKDDTAPLATINSDGLTIRYDGSSHAVLNSVNGAGDFTISTVGNILGTGVTNELTLKNGTGADDQYAVFGNGSEAVVLTSKSTQDIRLNTNSGTNSGFIHITDGSNGLITIQPDGTGTLLLGATAGSVQFATNTFLDANGNSLFGTAVASSAVNNIELGNAATGNPATLKATGTDTNVPLTVSTKGTGNITLDGGGDIELNADGGNITFKDDTTDLLTIQTDEIKTESPFKVKESAAAVSDTAAYGQIWIKNSAPNELAFTDDAGTDIIGVGKYMYDIQYVGYYSTSAAASYLPINGYIFEQTSTSGRNEYIAFVAPFNGTLEKIMWRSEIAQDGTFRNLIWESTDGTEVPGTIHGRWDPVVDVADDTTVEFDFTATPTSGTNVLTKGRIYAIGIDPASAPNDTNATVVFKWDITS